MQPPRFILFYLCSNVINRLIESNILQWVSIETKWVNEPSTLGLSVDMSLEVFAAVKTDVGLGKEHVN